MSSQDFNKRACLGSPKENPSKINVIDLTRQNHLMNDFFRIAVKLKFRGAISCLMPKDFLCCGAKISVCVASGPPHDA
jgi:hypothetical protein